MEPSLSLDATVVLRSGQDESRFGARVVFDSTSGAIRSDHDDAVAEGPAPASLRAVAGRWLFDAASETRVSVNGVAVGGARLLTAGDVITIGVDGSRDRALELLRGQPFVREAGIENEELRIYVDHGETAMPGVLRILDGAGIELQTLGLSRPSLDDVFLRQTGRSLREVHE